MASDPNSLASSIGVLAALAAVPFCWYKIVRLRRAMGRSAAFAHAVSVVAAPFVMMATFGLIADPSWFSLCFAAFVFGMLYLFVRPRAQPIKSTVADLVPVTDSPPPVTVVADLEPIEATRQESLAAIKRATKARENDKKREAPIEDPLTNWKRTAPPEPPARTPRKTARKKAPVKGGNLDVVRFDYINGEGEYSSRRLVVRVIAAEYFEGFDTERLETRTFRFDRVVGDITSEKTGEIIDPFGWADSQAKKACFGYAAVGSGSKADSSDSSSDRDARS